MAPEVKSKESKAKRFSGQTLRLRKKRWLLTGLKADRKYVGKKTSVTSVRVKKR